MTRSPLSLLSLLLAIGIGCSDKGVDDTANFEESDADADADADSDADADADADVDIYSTISGSVTVELYTLDENGARQYISYEDATGGVFPWEKIFVGAYYTGSSGAQSYVATDAIVDATTGPNPYQLDAVAPPDTSVYVYATLDENLDSIVGTDEPRGIYPMELPLTDGGVLTEVDITILAPAPGSGDGGGGGGESCDEISIAGDVILTLTYDNGDVAVMLADTAGQGPYESVTTTLTEDGGGATGVYELPSCAAYGDMQLLGAWDSDMDSMFSPADHWGAYISEPDVDGNPINVGYTDLLDYDVQIPLGDGPGLSIVPFIQIAGTVSMMGGTFDDLPPGSTVYVAALKYRPNTDLNIAETSNVYDIDTFEWSDITGQTSKDFALVVPADTIVYLWAYADTDADGFVNEVGDPVSVAGEDENGRFPTGTTSVGGVALELAVP